MNKIPLLRFELEGIQHNLITALANHSEELNGMVENAVKQYCTPENLEQVIYTKAETVIKDAIEREVESFYLYGEGRKVIKEAVEKQLSSEVEAT